MTSYLQFTYLSPTTLIHTELHQSFELISECEWICLLTWKYSENRVRHLHLHTQHDISIVPLNILLHLKINAFFSHFIHLFHFSSIFVASLTWWCLLSSATSTALCHVQKETWPLTCRYLSPRCSDSIQRIRFSRVCVYVLHWTHFHLLTCLVLFLLCKCSQVLLRRIGDMPCVWVSHVRLYVRSWQTGWLKIFLSVL